MVPYEILVYWTWGYRVLRFFIFVGFQTLHIVAPWFIEISFCHVRCLQVLSVCETDCMHLREKDCHGHGKAITWNLLEPSETFPIWVLSGPYLGPISPHFQSFPVTSSCVPVDWDAGLGRHLRSRWLRRFQHRWDWGPWNTHIVHQ